MEYIYQVFEEHPRIGEMKGLLHVEAEAILDGWEVRHTASIKSSKAALSKTPNVRDFLERQRLGAMMGDIICKSHETFAAVLAPPTHTLQRWQRWLVIFTLVLGVFTVDICASSNVAGHYCTPRMVPFFPVLLLWLRAKGNSGKLPPAAVTLLISGLYWNKATQCCTEVRNMLDCSLVFTEPCRRVIVFFFLSRMDTSRFCRRRTALQQALERSSLLW